MSRGGSARVRRTARRAESRHDAEGLRKAIDAVAEEGLDSSLVASDTTEEADELAADGEKCMAAGCGHYASAHGGEDNLGACSMQNCDCKAFDMGDDEASAETEEAAAESVEVAAPALVYTMTTTNRELHDAYANANGGSSVENATVTIRLSDLKLEPVTAAAVELPTEMQPVESVPQGGGDVIQPSAPAASGAMRWTAILCPEGQATDDGRIFAPGSITWRNLPLTLMGMVETQEGHDGAQVCGRIDDIWREEATGLIRGAGEFDSGDFGATIARLVGDETLRGVSVDIAVSEMEIAYRSEIVDENGAWIEDQQQDDAEEGSDGPSMIDILFGDSEDDVMFVVRQGVIGAATVCPFPAFADASIEVASSLVASPQPMVWTVTQQGGFVVTRHKAAGEPVEASERPGTPGLTASAAGYAPEQPPADWFADPELDELTGLTIDDDGRVFGHAAGWDDCHIGIPGVCTTAPHSHSDYAYFHLKEVVCDDGTRIACGTVTLDTGHADRDLGRAAAAAHYDHTGAAAADVVVGEDEHGIWVAGALRGDCDAERARKLRGAALSGDWRDVNGNLELVGLLAVNVPGFPIPRTRAAIVASADGNQPKVTSLIAAGVHADGKVAGIKTKGLSASERAQLDALADVAAGAWDDVAA